MSRKDILQSLCRKYLTLLLPNANMRGLGEWVKKTIDDNARGECEATEQECRLLAKMCDDERLKRTEVPELMGKSYRRCEEDGTFDSINKLERKGVYDKISALFIRYNNNKKD